MKQLANEYIEWATERFNRTRKIVPAEAMLCEFVIDHKLSSQQHSELFWTLVNQGAL